MRAPRITGKNDLSKTQYLLSRAANPDVVNSAGETADKVSGAGAEVFLLVEKARQKKQGAVTCSY